MADRKPTTVLATSQALARAQHAGQGRLLGRSDAQAIRVLDSHPALGVGAIEGREWGLPLVRGAVALRLVHIISDGPQLGVGNVVGVLGTLRSGPGIGAGLVKASQRSCHVVLAATWN